MIERKLGFIFIAVLVAFISGILFLNREDAPEDSPVLVENENEIIETEAQQEPAQTEGEETTETTPVAQEGYVIIGGESYSIELTELDLSIRGLQNEDIIPLAEMTELVWLNLYGNEISDLSPLSGLTNLSMLYMGENQISDLSPISGLSGLTELFFPHNQISDLSPLSALSDLFLLNFADNSVSDLSPLSELPNLLILVLAENQISDISLLSDFPLRAVYLYGNPIADYTPLDHVFAVHGRPTPPGHVMYQLSADPIVQGIDPATTEGSGLWTLLGTTPHLLQAGSPTYTVVEGPFGNAIQVTNRVNTWDSLDLPLAMHGFYDLENEEYELTVHGRNLSEFPIWTAIAAMDGPWNWLYFAEVAAGEEFTLNGIISAEILNQTDGGIEQFLQRGFRIQTPCLNSYSVDEVIITKR